MNTTPYSILVTGRLFASKYKNTPQNRHGIPKKPVKLNWIPILFLQCRKQEDTYFEGIGFKEAK